MAITTLLARYRQFHGGQGAGRQPYTSITAALRYRVSVRDGALERGQSDLLLLLHVDRWLHRSRSFFVLFLSSPHPPHLSLPPALPSILSGTRLDPTLEAETAACLCFCCAACACLPHRSRSIVASSISSRDRPRPVIFDDGDNATTCSLAHHHTHQVSLLDSGRLLATSTSSFYLRSPPSAPPAALKIHLKKNKKLTTLAIRGLTFCISFQSI